MSTVYLCCFCFKYQFSKKIELPGTLSAVDRYAFKYSDVQIYLKTLIFHKSDKVFMIYPESFAGLIRLENLELDVGPILLQPSIFNTLPSLKFLKIEVIETHQYLSQVLSPLINLETLEIVGNQSVGICQNIFSFKIPRSLTDIRYTNGPLKELPTNSMTCMPQLEKFTITNTQLKTIQSGAFKSMKNLKYVNLAFNQITRISKDTFEGLECNFLHLSHNNIMRIEFDAFKHTEIENLYLFNITSIFDVNINVWGLPEFTHVYYTPENDKSFHFFKHPVEKA